MSKSAKIAVATDDGIHVSAHFGRAPYFAVLTIEDGQVTRQERRSKAYHQGNHHEQHEHGGQDTHASGMVSVVADCSAIIAGGMGRPAYQSILAAGLVPILTELADVGRVGDAFAAGTLVNHPERVH